MHKVSIRLAIATAVVGLLLFFPLGRIPWLSYNVVLTIHVLLGITLGFFLFRILYSHVPSELYNPFRRGFKKWNGIKLFLYLFLGILSGITLLFFSKQWLYYFHGFIGLWALLVGWKHTK
jgi:hypothetical protein